jgi:hypothetical protein
MQPTMSVVAERKWIAVSYSCWAVSPMQPTMSVVAERKWIAVSYSCWAVRNSAKQIAVSLRRENRLRVTSRIRMKLSYNPLRGVLLGMIGQAFSHHRDAECVGKGSSELPFIHFSPPQEWVVKLIQNFFIKFGQGSCWETRCLASMRDSAAEACSLITCFPSARSFHHSSNSLPLLIQSKAHISSWRDYLYYRNLTIRLRS